VETLNRKQVEAEESRNKPTNNKVNKNGEPNTLKAKMICLNNFSIKLTIKNSSGKRNKTKNKINPNLRYNNKINKRQIRKNNNKNIKKERTMYNKRNPRKFRMMEKI